MTVLDAKVINTDYGLETYLDVVNNIEVKQLVSPTIHDSYYGITIGINYFRLREGNYYCRERNYFKLCMSTDLTSITLIETEKESLFAVKSSSERGATLELVGGWLIHTHAFKEAINELINAINDNNEGLEEHNKIGTLKFLEKLLTLEKEDIISSNVREYVSQ